MQELATDALSEWLDEAREDADAALGELLWGLARASKPQELRTAWRFAGQESLLWLQKALAFLPEGPLWRAMALCHQQLGDKANCRRCLAAALRHSPQDVAANMLLLLEATDGDAAEVRRLVGAVREGQVPLGAREARQPFEKGCGMQVAFVVGKQQASELGLEVIDLLVELLRQAR